MKLIVAHRGIKREVTGAFALCASREDLEHLAATIQRELQSKDWIYGWLDVYPSPRIDHRGAANTEPIGWCD